MEITNSSETSVSNYTNRKFRPILWTLVSTYVVNIPPQLDILHTKKYFSCVYYHKEGDDAELKSTYLTQTYAKPFLETFHKNKEKIQ